VDISFMSLPRPKLTNGLLARISRQSWSGVAAEARFQDIGRAWLFGGTQAGDGKQVFSAALNGATVNGHFGA
jgi:hypothetical protein